MRSPFWRLVTREDADLLVAVAASLILAAVILAVPSAKSVRIVLGLPFVLLFPGYTLMAALFPRKDDLDPIGRVALSLGLSIAVVPLIGLALNWSPWGIRLTPVLVLVTLFIALTAAAALYQRRLLPADEAFGLSIDIPTKSWSGFTLLSVDRLLTIVLVLSLVGVGATVLFATTRGGSEQFTEFYALGPGGKA